MKFRTSFVSNSSSCSFILGLDHEPKDYKEFAKTLFGDQEIYVSNDGDKILTRQLAKNILRELHPASEEDLLAEFSDDWCATEEESAAALKKAKDTILYGKKLFIVELDDCSIESYALNESMVRRVRINHH